MPGLVLDIFIEFLIRMGIKACRRTRSRAWPVVTARVESSVLAHGFSCHLVEVRYKYKVAGEPFTSTHKEPFLVKDLASDYVRRFPADSETPVRVNPADPAKSCFIRG